MRGCYLPGVRPERVTGICTQCGCEYPTLLVAPGLCPDCLVKNFSERR